MKVMSLTTTMFLLSMMTAEAFSSTLHIPQTISPTTITTSTTNPLMKRSSSSSSSTTFHNNLSLEKIMNYRKIKNSKTTMNMSLSLLSGLRGGSTTSSTLINTMTSTPLNLFNTNLIALGLTTAIIRIMERINAPKKTTSTSSSSTTKPASVKSLQIRFLSVFWLLRCADWLQGPYFYEVYSSKILNGVPASLATVSKLFLTGFASTVSFSFVFCFQ